VSFYCECLHCVYKTLKHADVVIGVAIVNESYDGSYRVLFPPLASEKLHKKLEVVDNTIYENLTTAKNKIKDKK